MKIHFCSVIVVAVVVAFATPMGAQVQHWEQAGYGGSGFFPIVAVDPTDSNTVYLGSDVAGVYKSVDGSDTFSPMSNGLKSLQISNFAIDPSDTQRLWAGTPVGLHLSTNGGTSWTVSNSSIHCFKHVSHGGIAVSPDGQTVLVASHAVELDTSGDGTLYLSTNGGGAWTAVKSFPNATISAVAIDQYLPTRAFLLSSDQDVLRSTDSGATWQTYSAGLPAGRTWRQLSVGRTMVFATAEPTAEGTTGGVFKSAKDSAAWVAIDIAPPSGEEVGGEPLGDPIRVDPTSVSDQVVYVGQDAWPEMFFKTTNGGTSWTGTSVEDGYQVDLVNAPHQAWMDSYAGPFDIAVDPQHSDTVFYTTWLSLWRSSDGGANFTEKIVGAQNTCTTAVLPISGALLATNMDGGIYRSTDDGATWTSAFPQEAVPLEFWMHAWSIEMAAGGDLYFGAGTTDGPTVYRSTDNGVSWQATGAGLPSSGDSERDNFIEISLAADPNDPATVYAGVNLYGLYKTVNSGQSWQLVENRFGENGGDPEEEEPVTKCVEVDPNNSQRIFVGEYWGGVRYSEDGGASWSAATGLQESVQDIVALADGRIFAAHADGVYLSTDNGHSFSASYSDPVNLGENELEYVEAIAVNPDDPNDLAMCTAKRWPVWHNRGSVWRSTDGGTNWFEITGDIPAVRVKDVAFSGGSLYAATWCANVYATSLDIIVPEGGFSWTPVNPTAGEVVQFTDESTPTPTTWSWSFGDGGTSTVSDPTHTYQSAGDYDVTLTASSNSSTVFASASLTVGPAAGGPPITSPGAYVYVIPASAKVAGALGTNWLTDVVVSNGDDYELSAAFFFLEGGRNNSDVTGIETMLPSFSSFKREDFLATVFGRQSTSGAIVIGADQPVVVTSRTYNDQGEDGTFGQFIPGYPLDSAMKEGGPARLVQLISNDDYRTNIGFVNVSEQTITIEVQLFSGDGAFLGDESYDLRPFEYRQVNDIISDFTAAAIDDAFAVVVSDCSDACFFAYASVIDNRTGDPVFIPAAR